MIDNGKNGADWTFATSEAIHTASAPAVAALLRRLSSVAGKKLRDRWEVTAGFRYMKSAYKQIPFCAEQSSKVVIIVFDVAAYRWRFVYRAHCFRVVELCLAFQPRAEPLGGNCAPMVGDRNSLFLRRFSNSRLQGFRRVC